MTDGSADVALHQYDVLIIGAGAAGLFCAAQLGQMGQSVCVLDNGKKIGRKILMSGGGRCNFTNLNIEPAAFLSNNPHFCKSALSRYTQWDFIELVNRYQIPYHEKTLGQLFCDDSAQDIVDMLIAECELGSVTIQLRQEITAINCVEDNHFQIISNNERYQAKSVVIATGGLSMPGLGATPLGYKIAEQFGLTVLPTRAGLVPLTLHKTLLDITSLLSGISVEITVDAECGQRFRESLLFTHRGLSGPAILQISNYWQQGQTITLNLLPDIDLTTHLFQAQKEKPNQQTKTVMAGYLPKRFLDEIGAIFADEKLVQMMEKPLKQLIHAEIELIAERLHAWVITPNATEGYRTAEVTLGGVDTNQLSSKTMEAKTQANLYFIGEVMDVTGWLGGYNFQWAWSSAWACAQGILAKAY